MTYEHAIKRIGEPPEIKLPNVTYNYVEIGGIYHNLIQPVSMETWIVIEALWKHAEQEAKKRP